LKFEEVWEILACTEDDDTSDIVAEYRLRAFIDLINDEKRLEKTNDRFVNTLKVRGAIPILKQMFGVTPNEPATNTGTTGAKTLTPFQETSSAVFG
jgi:hypothetical protein